MALTDQSVTDAQLQGMLDDLDQLMAARRRTLQERAAWTAREAELAAPAAARRILGPDIAGNGLNLNSFAGGHAILLPARFNDCVHTDASSLDGLSPITLTA